MPPGSNHSTHHEERSRSFEWFAVHTRSRHEFLVKDQLANNGIEAFLPTVERLRRWKDRNKKVTFPLFSGYLFIRIERSHQSIFNVLKTKGVVRILGNAENELLSIPDETIEALKKLVQEKTELDPYPYLKEGERVRIKYGPLRGIEGILIEKSGQHKVVISVDLIQQSAAMTINIIDIENV